MRRAVKPFTVEVKKRKKPGQSSSSLFSDEQLALAQEDAPSAASRWFDGMLSPLNDPPAPARTTEPSSLAVVADAARGRVLPDLTPPRVELQAERAPLEYDDLPKPRRPRQRNDAPTVAARPAAPRKPRAKAPVAATPVASVAVRPAAKAAPARVAVAPRKAKAPSDRRQERRLLAKALLGPGERWKRRLPPNSW